LGVIYYLPPTCTSQPSLGPLAEGSAGIIRFLKTLADMQELTLKRRRLRCRAGDHPDVDLKLVFLI
jgi:hypothetical protein